MGTPPCNFRQLLDSVQGIAGPADWWTWRLRISPSRKWDLAISTPPNVPQADVSPSLDQKRNKFNKFIPKKEETNKGDL